MSDDTTKISIPRIDLHDFAGVREYIPNYTDGWLSKEDEMEQYYRSHTALVRVDNAWIPLDTASIRLHDSGTVIVKGIRVDIQSVMITHGAENIDIMGRSTPEPWEKVFDCDEKMQDLSLILNWKGRCYRGTYAVANVQKTFKGHKPSVSAAKMEYEEIQRMLTKETDPDSKAMLKVLAKKRLEEIVEEEPDAADRLSEIADGTKYSALATLKCLSVEEMK